MKGSILKLETPCGTFMLYIKKEKKIPLYVSKNKFDCDYEFENPAAEIKINNTIKNKLL